MSITISKQRKQTGIYYFVNVYQPNRLTYCGSILEETAWTKALNLIRQELKDRIRELIQRIENLPKEIETKKREVFQDAALENPELYAERDLRGTIMFEVRINDKPLTRRAF